MGYRILPRYIILIVLILIGVGVYLWQFGPTNSEPVDVSTYANIDDLVTQHMHLDYTVDMDKEKIIGKTTLSMKVLKPNLKYVDLDIQGLWIDECFDTIWNKLDFEIINKTEVVGKQLRISLFLTPVVGEILNITVKYETTNTSKAFSWLKPAQTFGGKYKYMFTQNEPIYARSVTPCQDTPSIKMTYTASAAVTAPLWVYMSANITDQVEGRYYNFVNFSMPVPIPSYLIAIAAGNIEEKRVGNRTYVLTEPEFMKQTYDELIDMEKFLTTIESYITPYHWGVYKILILPPSFPYGGMENPLLTTATPSLIYPGDKSLVGTVIHEMCHSWTGNSVTNKNWASFWLNEGFTRFLERKTQYLLRGEDYYKIDSFMGYQTLLDDIAVYGPDSNFTSLNPQLKDRNPDDAFSRVPYEKGYQFASYLEHVVGNRTFQHFMRAYIIKYRGKSLNHDEFKDTFMTFMNLNLGVNASKILSQIDWNTWFNAPGVPVWHTNFDTPAKDDAINLATAFIEASGDPPANYTKWEKFNVPQKVTFINSLLNKTSQVYPAIMSAIFNAYRKDFDGRNHLIMSPWLRLTILTNYLDHWEDIDTFLGKCGRFAWLRPVYRALAFAGRRLEGIKYLEKYIHFYHPIAVALIKKDLNYTGNSTESFHLSEFDYGGRLMLKY